MCGRYAASGRPEDMVEEFEVEVDETTDAATAVPEPNFNVAPTDLAPVVLERASRREAAEAPEDGADGANGQDGAPPVRRRLRLLKWGLVPAWSKDAAGGARMINARAESLFDKPAYK